ncbi:MAG: type II secretion system protein N [Halioglobus sp.]
MSRFRLGILLASFLLVLMVTSAPARLLGLLVPADRLVLQGLSGSLWQGSAARCLVATGNGYVHLGAVTWQLSPLSLLHLSPSLKLESRWGSQRISGQVTLRNKGDFEFHELQATVSSQLLRQFAPLMIEGRLSLQFPHLRVRDGLPYMAEGRVLWEGAQWLLPQGPLPLGSYAVDVDQQAEQGLTGDIITLSGPIEATGSVEVQGRNYGVDVLVASRFNMDRQLQHALSLFAEPVSEGYRVQLSGEF